MAQPDKKRRNRSRKGYIPQSPAVCLVVHDPSGRIMPERVADEIINSVFPVVKREGYLISFTRT